MIDIHRLLAGIVIFAAMALGVFVGCFGQPRLSFTDPMFKDRTP